MRFRARVEPPEPMRGLEVPQEVVEALGAGKRPTVTITINGHSWRSRIAIMRGRYLIGLSNANRQAAGVVTARAPRQRAGALGRAGLKFAHRPTRFRASPERRRALVAQLDRASDYESEGRAFESLRARHSPCLRPGDMVRDVP